MAASPFSESLEPRRLLAAGDLDMFFGGGDGVATFSTQAGLQIDRGLFTAIDSQGRIVTAGVTAANRNFGTPVDILITRYTPDGLPDPSFGGGAGFVTRSFLNADVATDLAVTADDKILVAFRNTTPATWSVLRLNEDGSQDSTFGNVGTTGVAAYDFGTETISRMIVQHDGKIVTVGTATNFGTGNKAAVVRMHPGGALDNSFGSGGIATVEFSAGGLNEFVDVALDGDTKIVAAGRGRAAPINANFDRIAVARLSVSDGELDSSFDGDGRAEIPPAGSVPAPTRHYLAHSVAVDFDSRVVVAGFVPADTNPVTPRPLNFFRLTADGAPDTSFNASGAERGRLEFPNATMIPTNLGDLLLQPDDKYLFGGSQVTASSQAFTLVRVDPDGTPDENFSEDGVVNHTPTTPALSGGSDVALDSSLRAVMSGVVVVNTAPEDFDFASIRVDLGLQAVSPVTLAGGVLTIRGSDANDTVLLRRAGDLFLVTFNGAGYQFNYADVQSIDVELFGGDDRQTHDGGVPGGRIDLGAGTTDSVTLNTGNRADSLLNIFGGDGNDTVTLHMAAFTPIFFDGGDDGAFTDFLVYHGAQGNDTLNISNTRIDNGGALEAEYARVSHVTVHGNFGSDTFNVSGTAQGIYELIGGDGHDTFVLTNGAPNTQLGQVEIDGGNGEDSFTYDDAAGGSAQGASIFQNGGNFNGRGVDFAVESLRYIDGPAAHAIAVHPSTTTRMTIEGSLPGTYPGDRLLINPAITPAAHSRTNFADGHFTFDGGYLPVQYVGFERVVSNLDTDAPTATAQFNYETRQEIEFNFSEDIYFSLDPADLELTNLTAGQVISGDEMVMNASGGVNFINRVTWRPGAGQILPDGNYRARIPASAIRDYSDKPLADDLTLDFFVLAGDANRDRSVGFADLVILAQNYNTSGKTFAQGNFNHDPAGEVDFQDLVILAQRYGTNLPVAGVASNGEAEAGGAARPVRDRVFNSTVPVRPPAAARKPRPGGPGVR